MGIPDLGSCFLIKETFPHASYEKETNHGIEESAQSIWNEKIKLDLKKLEKYASS